MRKEIKTERFLEGIQISTKIIKEATGIVLAKRIRGVKSSRTRLKRDDSAASKEPAKTPHKKPVEIRSNEKPMDFQKAAVRVSSKSLLRTATGDTRRMGWFNFQLASCQMRSQKKTAQGFKLTGDFCFWQVPGVLSELWLVIEVISWKCTSYGFWILLKENR